ncbi:MAG TPA: hypothetical protein ENJ33_08345 [Thiothrix sp.]|nr:hypothetical protein [Thiothrix sp.]
MPFLKQAKKVAISTLFVLFSTILVSNTSAEDLPEAMNHIPNAVDDIAETTLNTPVPITILDNDSDLDNDLLEIIGYTNPTHGFIEQQGNHFVYTPNANFIGTDTFDYTISDGYLTETTATATSTAIAVLAPEGDFTDTDTFTFTINDNEGGEAIADADGTATIFRNVNNSPNSTENTENTESITFTISNALDGEAIATATAIAIASTEDATATATATAVAIHTPTEDFTDSETFIYTLTSNNNSETSVITETVAEIIYTPSENNFSYTVRNANGETVTATTIAIAIATASATITALTADTATVSINVQPEKPTVTLAATNYTTTYDAGTVQVADWITQATDGRGGTQLPYGGDNLEPIYFYVTSNSNPALFSEQPWLSHPSHSLHFTTQDDTQGSAEICMKAVTKKGHGVSSEIQCFTITITDPYQQPSFILAATNYTTPSDTGTVHVPAWITRAMDGMGGTQLPNGGDNLEPIYFYVTSNSNPALFSEQPWLSYPSHSLHFKTQANTHGSAEICMKAVTKKGHGISSEIQCFTITITEVPIELPVETLTETETTTDSNSPSSSDNAQPENTAVSAPSSIAVTPAVPITVVNTATPPTHDDSKTITEAENTKGAGGSFNIALLVLLVGLSFIRRKNRQNIIFICLSDANNKISTNAINNR